MYMVTGATGFIGRAFIQYLIYNNKKVVAIVRHDNHDFPSSVITLNVNTFFDRIDWPKILNGVEVIIHLAGKAHVYPEETPESLSEFEKVNTDATLILAKKAAESNVRRLIYLSTVKVNGECTKLGKSFKPSDKCFPNDHYGRSKLKAEQGLFEISAKTNLEVVVIRPPLVYGPGVKANFLSMMDWVYRGYPLPLKAIKNSRSFLALDNLIDLINICTSHPAAANQIFFASDGDDISTSELLIRTGKSFNRPVRLFSIPVVILSTFAAILGKKEMINRLCKSLTVDISKTNHLIGWVPPLTMEEGLDRATNWYLRQHIKKQR